MKFIKLNRRFNQFKEARHTVCFRFDSYSNQSIDVEQALRSLTNTGGWEKNGEWYGYFGKGRSPRPYFITVRDEALASMVLLKISNDATIA